MGKEVKNVLIDTSAWVEFFRNNPETADTVTKIIEDGRACICGVIYFELLQGIRTGEDPGRLIDLLTALDFMEITAEIWIKAGSISAALRKQGTTLPMSDLLIAATAIERGLSVLTYDEHFSSIPGLNLYRQ
ncbi:MAG: PIN domain-containing protein [Nitrospiraceae bacterium]|nr:PIN domain-containing protein [Nitrospiraceae bacterium]